MQGADTGWAWGTLSGTVLLTTVIYPVPGQIHAGPLTLYYVIDYVIGNEASFFRVLCRNYVIDYVIGNEASFFRVLCRSRPGPDDSEDSDHNRGEQGDPVIRPMTSICPGVHRRHRATVPVSL
jgi:hypothetical protein